jgi:hypothetical protein
MPDELKALLRKLQENRMSLSDFKESTVRNMERIETRRFSSNTSPVAKPLAGLLCLVLLQHAPYYKGEKTIRGHYLGILTPIFLFGGY